MGKGWERGGFVLLIIRGDYCSPVNGGVPHAAIVRVHVDLSSDTTHLTTLTALLHLSPHLQILCHSWTLSVNSTATLTVSGYRTETIVTISVSGYSTATIVTISVSGYRTSTIVTISVSGYSTATIVTISVSGYNLQRQCQ